MKINSGGTGWGATYWLHLCKQYLEIYPSPWRQSKDPIKQLDACSFIFFTCQIRTKKEKGKMLGLELRAGRWFCVKYQHPQHQNTGNWWNGSSFIPRPESELRHLVRRRDGAGAKPSESGKSRISRGFGSGSYLQSKEGFSFDRISII